MAALYRRLCRELQNRPTPGPQRLHKAMQYQVGAILWHPRTGRKLYTMATVPDAVVHSWIPKKQMIGQVELF
eukprot:3784278-Amphidinium_carterae.1